MKPSEKFYEDPKQKPPQVLRTSPGMHRFVWDMRYAPAEDLKGTQILWGGSTRGPKVIPGDYKVRLLADEDTIATKPFEVRIDPRLDTTEEEFQEQLALYRDIQAKLDTTHKVINRIRTTREKINGVLDRIEEAEELAGSQADTVKATAEAILDSLAAIEGNLVQTRAESFQDVLNYPIKLNNKLAALASAVESADQRPTVQMHGVYEVLSERVDRQFKRLEPVWEERIPAFNRMVKTLELPAVPE